MARFFACILLNFYGVLSFASPLLVSGEIAGHRVVWLVDTGASEPVLSRQMATRLGLDIQSSTDQVAHSAGISTVARTWLRGTVIDQHHLPDLSAIVMPGNHPKYPLMGLSALRYFTLILDQGQMTLEPARSSGIIRRP